MSAKRIISLDLSERNKLTRGYFFVIDGPDGTFRVRTTDVGGVGLTSKAIPYCYVDVSDGVGTTIDLTQRKDSSNYSSIVVPCKSGDFFRIKGIGGNKPRLWALLDENGVVLNVADANTSTNYYIVVSATHDGYFVANGETSSLDVTLIGFNISNCDYNGILLDNSVLSGTIKDDLSPFTTQDGYIVTGVNVGEIVDLETIVQSENYRSVVRKVRKGDLIKCKGYGGTSPRLWAFLDENNRLISSAIDGLGVKNTYLMLSAPSNGTFVGGYNINNSSYPGEFFCYNSIDSFRYFLNKKLENLGVDISNLSISIQNLSNDLLDVSTKVNDLKNISTYKVNQEQFRECLALYTNGDTTDYIVTPSTGFKSIVLNCKIGDVFYITGYGGDSPRLWALVDDNGNIYQRSAASLNGNNVRVEATKNGKLVVNTSMDRNIPFGITSTSIEGFINDTIEKRNYIHTLCLANPPLVELNNNSDFLDLTEDISVFDFSYSNRGPTNMLEQVQSKMDLLAQSYPSYMTSVDISQETGIPYPRYAQGIPSGDPEYWACPAYTQKLYKLIGNDSGMGNLNGRNPKKKILIIAGQHGDEVASCVNLYILAKRLCESKDSIYFKLRSSCEFYLFPCVNGYGLHFYNRLNGNHVDINRNYPIRCWKPTTSGFSGGTVAGDQFETQCVLKLCDLYNFDIAIDHHNYTNYVVEVENVPQQLYSNTSCISTLKAIYSSFVDCSFAFIKNLPYYFGNNWKMFTGNHGAPKELQTWLNGTASRWFFENVTDISATIEISNVINFLNGIPHVGNETEYDVNTFKIAEYTLRSQIINFVNLSYKKLIQTGLIN